MVPTTFTPLLRVSFSYLCTSLLYHSLTTLLQSFSHHYSTISLSVFGLQTYHPSEISHFYTTSLTISSLMGYHHLFYAIGFNSTMVQLLNTIESLFFLGMHQNIGTKYFFLVIHQFIEFNVAGCSLHNTTLRFLRIGNGQK